jgi:hypothetical protein
LFPEGEFDDPVFQGVKGDDYSPSSRMQQPDAGGKPPFQTAQFIIDRDP